MNPRRRRPIRFGPLDPTRIRTIALARRSSKVELAAAGRPVRSGLSVRRFLDGLPDILAGHDLRLAASAIARAVRRRRPVVLGMGAHPIKVGLSPLIVDLLDRGRVSALALNGACLVHDFELAWGGRTSEDVGPGLDMAPGEPPAVPPVVRAHDDAVGALMAAHTAAQLAAWRAEPGRPPLAYVRPPVERNATFHVERMRRYAEDGYQAARLAIAPLVART